VKVSYRATEELREPVFGISFFRSDGVCCFGCNTSETGKTPKFIKAGEEGELWFEIDDLALLPADYQVSISFHDLEQRETYDYHDRKYRFKVLKGPEVVIGLFNMPHRWTGWPDSKA
jgi:ABC-2 type transport system ATP-binding protein